MPPARARMRRRAGAVRVAVTDCRATCTDMPAVAVISVKGFEWRAAAVCRLRREQYDSRNISSGDRRILFGVESREKEEAAHPATGRARVWLATSTPAPR